MALTYLRPLFLSLQASDLPSSADQQLLLRMHWALGNAHEAIEQVGHMETEKHTKLLSEAQ